MTDGALVVALGLGAFVVGVLLAVEPDPLVPSAAAGWRELGRRRVTLRRGARYRGCVSVPIVSVGDAAVKARAEAAGFVDVRSVSSMPAEWSGGGTCEHFVEGTWARADATVDLPGVVRAAWERVS